MTVYKIRHASGKYSNGGALPMFSKTGKVWRNRAALSLHLSLIKEVKREDYYRDCQVEEYEMQLTRTWESIF